MTFHDLVRNTAKRALVPGSVAMDVVLAMLSVADGELSSPGNKVVLQGFGTLRSKTRKFQKFDGEPGEAVVIGFRKAKRRK
jgi:nucleoid DNA-binding protein